MFKYSKDGGTVGAGCTQGKEKRLVSGEDTGNPQPQAEILLHGQGIVKGGLGEPCRKQEPQAYRNPFQHREQFFHHQGTGRSPCGTWGVRL